MSTTAPQGGAAVAPEPQLVRGLGLTSATTLVMGSMIGSGIFIVSAGVVSPSAVPTTLVLNAKGEVTARILGRFEPKTLRILIDTALGK